MFAFFFQNHEMRPETESRNSGDQELWNHEMQGSPVLTSVSTHDSMVASLVLG